MLGWWFWADAGVWVLGWCSGVVWVCGYAPARQGGMHGGIVQGLLGWVDCTPLTFVCARPPLLPALTHCRRAKRRNAERLQLACGGFTVNSGEPVSQPARQTDRQPASQTASQPASAAAACRCTAPLHWPA